MLGLLVLAQPIYFLRSRFHLYTAWLLPSSATAVSLRLRPLPISCLSSSILPAKLLSFWCRSRRCDSSRYAACLRLQERSTWQREQQWSVVPCHCVNSRSCRRCVGQDTLWYTAWHATDLLPGYCVALLGVTVGSSSTQYRVRPLLQHMPGCSLLMGVALTFRPWPPRQGQWPAAAAAARCVACCSCGPAALLACQRTWLA